MHRVMREGTPEANAKFTAGLCRTATATPASEAQRTSDTLLSGGVAAVQSAMGGKSASLLLNKHVVNENTPVN